MAQLSSVYASAVFGLFVAHEADCEPGFQANYLEQVRFLRDALSEPDTAHFLAHPHIRGVEKRKFFETAFDGSIHTDLTGLIFLAITKNREAFIVPALVRLAELIEGHIHIARAKIITAVPLSAEKLSEMEALLSKKLDKTVIAEPVVDPAVIGGVYIAVDGHFIDKTVRTQLREMRRHLIHGDSAKSIAHSKAGSKAGS